VTIDVWPRMHMWALEWHDLSKDLTLKRGEPLFYVRFETTDPSSAVRLFETARERRAEKLLFRKPASAGGTPV
jgi:hypothetical protein